MSGFFFELPKNLIRCFRGKIFFWHILTIIITYTIVVSGFDWFYFTHTRSNTLQAILFPAAIVGGLLPILTPFIVLIFGKLLKNLQIKNTAYALGQAAALGWFVSAFYKTFTGRVPPPFHQIGGTTDISHVFQFGFMRGGIFWGWPSSHTTVAFAMAIALLTLYPKNKIIRFLAPLYALYIGTGISTNIHWFSDFVAGAIVGTVVGITVGRSFLNRLKLAQK